MAEHYYIYKYEHPDYHPFYIGLTTNINKRFNDHKVEDPRFNESQCYYFEVGNQCEMEYIEKYLINKYKPIWNVKDKYPQSSGYAISGLPEWKPYTVPIKKETKHRTPEEIIREKQEKFERGKAKFLNSVEVFEKKSESKGGKLIYKGEDGVIMLEQLDSDFDKFLYNCFYEAYVSSNGHPRLRTIKEDRFEHKLFIITQKQLNDFMKKYNQSFKEMVKRTELPLLLMKSRKATCAGFSLYDSVTYKNKDKKYFGMNVNCMINRLGEYLKEIDFSVTQDELLKKIYEVINNGKEDTASNN